MITLIAFVLVVGTLVVVHEFGHYLVARFIGVRVETFSIGFPPNVYRRRIGDTEWTIGLLPLGGYVKMAGDTPGYGSDDPAELQNRTRGERLAILFAGPAMNFVLAVAILAGLFYVGMERRIGLSDPPVVTYVAERSPADIAGIRSGDRIVTIAGEPVADWRTAMEAIIVRPDQQVVFGVEREGAPRDFSVAIRSEGPDAVGVAGVYPPYPPIIAAVAPDTPAETAGFAPGDRIVRVDGMPVGSTSEVAALVRSSGVREIAVAVARGDREIVFSVVPRLREDPTTGETVPQVGVQFQPPFRLVRAASIPDAVQEAVAETVRWGGAHRRPARSCGDGPGLPAPVLRSYRDRPGLRGRAPPRPYRRAAPDGDPEPQSRRPQPAADPRSRRRADRGAARGVGGATRSQPRHAQGPHGRGSRVHAPRLRARRVPRPVEDRPLWLTDVRRPAGSGRLERHDHGRGQ